MHSHLTLMFRIAVTVLCAALLSHCASGPPVPESRVENRDILPGDSQQTAPNDDVDQGDRATPYSQRRFNIERAEYYAALADDQGDDQQQVDAILSAAEYYIQANDYRSAKQTINRLIPDEMNTQQRNRYAVIDAYVAYSQKNFLSAIALLRELLTDSHSGGIESRTQHVDALLLSALCYQQLNDYQAAISALIQRESLLQGNARAETTRYIWQVISRLDIEQRQSIIALTDNAILRNRLEQSLDGQFGTLNELPDQFDQWRQPLTNDSKQTIDGVWNQSSPLKLAILLPFNSKFSKASQAVMDGIQYQHDNNTSSFKPQLEVYDIGDNPYLIPQYYAAALRTGAELVIGPLGKDYANQLSTYAMQSGSQPTILLGGDGFLSNQINNNVTRLTLSPEAEGMAVADRAREAGYVTAALLVPDTPLGQRTTDSFKKHWLNHGGNISKTVTYSPNQFDHSTELKQLFSINESEYRHRLISDALGFKPKFEAYRRADIDFIFMLADNKTGRIVRPQINFFSGQRIPVYATSSVFNGIQDTTNNLDLERTQFPIMPWVLQSTEVAPYAGQLNMLFAMGSDAYTIAGSFRSMRADSNLAVSGNMGRLHIDPSGEIIHQPAWATFKHGVAETDIALPTIIAPSQRQNDSGQNSSNVSTYNDANWDPRQSRRKASP